MAKLLTEAERYGSKNRSQKWGKRFKYNPDSDYDDQPYRASMSRHRQDDCGKNLSDVLNPLKGYLHKSVGRHWDDVYSEICQNLDRRSVTGLHVFTHLWQFVAKNTVMCIDGKVREWAGGGGYLTEPYNYYIHPYTGILCDSGYSGWREWRRSNRTRKEKPVTEIRLSDIGRYEKFDGIWYYCENYAIKHEGKTLIRPGYFRVNDAIKIDGEVNEEGEPLVFYLIKWTEHISTKRQLNRKELKKAGLKNDPPNPKAFSRRERKALERK
jgi:hypothetical protein